MAEWIPERGDSQARCGSDPGRVKDEELLAKYVSVGDWDADALSLNESSLTSSHLCPKGGRFSDICGDSDGVSVQRAGSWTPETAAENLHNFYQGKETVPECVVMAKADDLRRIRLQDKPNDQVVFVLDDSGDPGGKYHAIIRMSKPRTYLDYVRVKIIGTFRRF